MRGSKHFIALFVVTVTMLVSLISVGQRPAGAAPASHAGTNGNKTSQAAAAPAKPNNPGVATTQVSPPNQLTTGTNYDRNPSVVRANDGTYYLFFARTVSPCDRASCNNDNNQYNIFYMTSANGTAWSSPSQLSDRTGLTSDFYGRTIAATLDSAGTIWVFWASGGNAGALYYYTITNGVASARQTLNDYLYFNVEVVKSPDNNLRMLFENQVGDIYTRSYNGATWSAPVLVATGRSIPKVTVDGSVLRMVSVNPALGQDEYSQSTDNGATWSAPVTVVAPSGTITNWDPTIVRDAAGKLDVFFAPDLGDGQTQRLGWSQSTDNGATWSAVSKVTAASFRANKWWDYWPEATVIGSNTYLFYTSENNRHSTNLIGHIMSVKVDWNQGTEHAETIQSASDAASPGDTINIAAGTYDEQVDITTANITLSGAGSANTIVRPTSAPANTTSLSSGAPVSAIMLVHGVHGVTVQGIRIDGAGAATNSCAPTYMGIYFRNGSGTLQNSDVRNMLQPGGLGCQGELGVYIQSVDPGSAVVSVLNNSVTNYGKNGITANDDTFLGGAAGNTQATITGNTVTGRGPVNAGDAAQNGIQLGYGATGTVFNNNISNNSYIPASDNAAGVLLYQADANTSNNTLNQDGIAIYHISGSGTHNGNKITSTAAGLGRSTFWGIVVDAPPANRAPSPFSDGSSAGAPKARPASPSTAQVSVVTNNVLTSDGTSPNGTAIEADAGYDNALDMNFTASGNTVKNWGTGIEVGQCSSGCSGKVFTNATITGNALRGNKYGVEIDGGSNTVAVGIHNNTIAGNTTAGLLNNSPAIANADNNYWGDPSGPRISLVPMGTGDAVQGPATVNPYLTSPSATAPGAYAHFTPQAGAPASGGYVAVGTQFSLDMLLNSTTDQIVAADNYLTFSNNVLQNANASQPGCIITNTVTVDATTFSEVVQNNVCNGTANCNFSAANGARRGYGPSSPNGTAPGGTITFSSGAGLNPAASGDFRIAQIKFCAVATGDATLHWQFGGSRDSVIVDDSFNPLYVQNSSLYSDYVVHVVDPVLVGHVSWQGISGPTGSANVQPLTLTLKSGTYEINYPSVSVDASGFFTVNVTTLPATGTYSWRVKGAKYLASNGSFSFQRAISTPVEIGQQLAGDANNDNRVNALDYAIYRNTNGKGVGDPGYDPRGDFNNSGTVNAVDFNLLKLNYGTSGSGPLSPAGK